MTRPDRTGSWPARVVDAGRRVVRRIMLALAVAWHRTHPGVTFIGITGSCGKTSTKEMTRQLLGSHFPGCCSPRSLNGFLRIFLTVLRVRRRDRYCLMEVATAGAGTLDRVLPLVRPSVGVVLNVGTDHYKAFRGGTTVAMEKRRLVEALPPHGVAILNGDDPAVRAMAEHTRARVVLFGSAPGAHLRAEDVRCGWPEPLRLTVVEGEDRAAVEVAAWSANFVPNVLAAIAVGRAMGLSLADCARGIAGGGSYVGRLDARTLPDGVTFLCDYWKASIGSLPPALDALAQARVQRRIAVMGTLSDYPGAAGDRYRKVARQLLAVADIVIFVGPQAALVNKLQPEAGGRTLLALAEVSDVHAYLQRTLQKGDLVLLKGSGKVDHLERLVLAHERPVACWRSRCGRKINCHECSLLMRPERRRA